MTGWMVVYMTEKTSIRTGKRKLRSHYEPFIEMINGELPRNLARKRYEELLEKEEVYSVNLCHIKDSTEPHYLEVLDDNMKPIKKEKK